MDMTFVTNLLLASVRMATPLIFVSLAELYSQRAGLTNIGLEGLATIGSLVGFMVSLLTGSPLLGVLAGMLAGIIVNMIFAYATISLCAEQIVYGMAINIFAPALAAFIYRVYFGSGSDLVQVKLMITLANTLGITPNNFFTKLLLDQTVMVYFAYALVVFTAIYFNRTKSGLNYKAVGEYPKAAATLGIDVIKTKYLASVICGALAAVIFGRWSAGGVLLACLFFGFCDALQIRLQVASFGLPYQFFQMIPYVATVVVLALIGMKKAGPKSCGKPYRKEER